MKQHSLSGFSLGAGSELAKEKAAKSAYRAATRAAAKTARIAGVSIGGETKKGAALLTASPEELQAAAEALLQERSVKGREAMRNITATKGEEAHKKASLLFDLAGDKATRRRLRKQLEGKESGTALAQAADALNTSRELLEIWMSEGNTISLANDGKIMF